MTRDELTVDLFRSCGRSLRRGTPARVPSLPHSTRSLAVLRLAASRDADVRLAFNVAVGRAPTTVRESQVEQRILRRGCGRIIAVR